MASKYDNGQAEIKKFVDNIILSKNCAKHNMSLNEKTILKKGFRVKKTSIVINIEERIVRDFTIINKNVKNDKKMSKFDFENQSETTDSTSSDESDLGQRHITKIKLRGCNSTPEILSDESKDVEKSNHKLDITIGNIEEEKQKNETKNNLFKNYPLYMKKLEKIKKDKIIEQKGREDMSNFVPKKKIEAPKTSFQRSILNTDSKKRDYNQLGKRGKEFNVTVPDKYENISNQAVAGVSGIQKTHAQERKFLFLFK